MSLQYSLVDNPITPDPNDCRALLMVLRSLKIEDIIERVVSRGSTVTKAEALSVWEEICLAVVNALKEGYAINTELFRILPTITGVFINNEDSFDPSRHSINFRITPGERIRMVESLVTVEKVPASQKLPVLSRYDDTTTGIQDDVITPGKPARIIGGNLKFTESEAGQGIFFVRVADGVAIRVSEKLSRNKPGELIFLNPSNLTPGIYRLEVRTILPGNKSIRTGALPYEVTVS
jgi:hypothetical protein